MEGDYILDFDIKRVARSSIHVHTLFCEHATRVRVHMLMSVGIVCELPISFSHSTHLTCLSS